MQAMKCAAGENEPGQADARRYSEPTQADQVRAMLVQLALGQREASRVLEIGERDMRGYCSGAKVPRVVMLALEQLITQQRTIQSRK
jgi:hypothetical protein